MRYQAGSVYFRPPSIHPTERVILHLHQLDWQRHEQPTLSAMTTTAEWCRVQLYNPAVVRVNGIYRMWYLGNSTATRTKDMDLGTATSVDGIHWEADPANPILTARHLPAGASWQTPHVLFDEGTERFRMWFVMSDSSRDESGQVLRLDQLPGYAESRDGPAWQVHPEPLLPSGRRPCVLPRSGGGFVMWMNSQPDAEHDSYKTIAQAVYRFESDDGLHWTRDAEPMLVPSGGLQTIVYPFVLQDGSDLTMWYGAHVEGGHFELFASTSTDGISWQHHHDRSAFPATRDPTRFDGRYTSTPCVVDGGGRWLLYYSARDLGSIYGTGDGQIGIDADGIYRHIGVATAEK